MDKIDHRLNMAHHIRSELRKLCDSAEANYQRAQGGHTGAMRQLANLAQIEKRFAKEEDEAVKAKLAEVFSTIRVSQRETVKSVEGQIMEAHGKRLGMHEALEKVVAIIVSEDAKKIAGENMDKELEETRKEPVPQKSVPATPKKEAKVKSKEKAKPAPKPPEELAPLAEKPKGWFKKTVK